ncbi:MAG: flagellar export chaperone FlgN [Desulfonatronovibrio sp.]
MKIEDGLMRQKQAMGLLISLLEEEYSALANNYSREVSSLEFSIQELIRQLMDEKEAIRLILEKNSFAGLEDYIESLDQGEVLIIQEILEDLKSLEEVCSVQAAKNNVIASALAEQSAGLVKFLYDQITPREENVYSARGRWHDHGSKSTGLVRGML